MFFKTAIVEARPVFLIFFKILIFCFKNILFPEGVYWLENIVCLPRHFKYLINFVKISFCMLIVHVCTFVHDMASVSLIY